MHQLQELRVSGVDVIVVGEDEFAGGVDQEGAEDVEDPFETFDEGHAREDEHGAQCERTEDAPEQHAVLVALRDGEIAHHQRPHEDVVDAQALLDQIARDVLAARLGAEPPGHDPGERDTDADPDCGLDGRFLGRDLVCLPVDHQQVDEQHGHDERQERGPLPRGDVDVGEVGVALARCEQAGHDGRHHSIMPSISPSSQPCADQALLRIACAALSRAIGTRNGLHDT